MGNTRLMARHGAARRNSRGAEHARWTTAEQTGSESGERGWPPWRAGFSRPRRVEYS